MKTKEYIDEQLAKVRRFYLEDQIQRQEDQCIWKGEVYNMKALAIPELDFHISLPELFEIKDIAETHGEGEELLPFLIMLSKDRDIFCSFYNTQNSKVYEPADIHELFGTLYPDHDLSSLESFSNDGLDIFYLHYVSCDMPIRCHHTIFIFSTAVRQIIGHICGELTEFDKLQMMERKILNTIKL